MFEFVRTHTRLLQFLLLLLIVPSFVVFGIQGYSRFTDGANNAVAKVDGHSITQAEWDAAHQRQVARLSQQMPGMDIKMFDTPAARQETLDALVRERVMLGAAQKLHLVVSDERLDRLFKTDPQFAQMRNPDGSVNKDILAAQGMSSQGFAAQLRQDLSMQQVTRGVTNSVLAPAAAASAALDALLQRRELTFVRFEPKSYLADIKPSDADIEAYYKAHEAEFRAPEQATIDYVVLDIDVLKKGVAVPEDDLKKYYAENASRWTVAEERRARHILVKAEKDAPADVKAKAKAKAEGLLAEVRKAPASFGELARKNSDDPGSAAKGGDLDFFGRGAMVKPFEDSAFAMKPGEISNLVETDFGFHIIALDAVRGGDKKPFEAARAEIEDEVRKQLATKKWAEAAEQFTNTVYEQSDSLQPVIDKLKLDKRTATVQRSAAPDAKGALASPKLLEAIFGNEALRNKRNTDAVEVGPNQLAAARVTNYQAARTLPLAEVKDKARERVAAAQAAAAARKDGEARLAALRSGGAGELPLKATVSRADPQSLPREALDAVLRADTTKLPALLGTDLGEQAGYLVARVEKVLPRDAAMDAGGRLQSQYGQAWALAEAQAYYASLKQRHKAEVTAAPASAPLPQALSR